MFLAQIEVGAPNGIIGLGIFPFVQLVTDYTDYTDYFNDIMTCLGMKKLFFSNFFKNNYRFCKRGFTQK